MKITCLQINPAIYCSQLSIHDIIVSGLKGYYNSNFWYHLEIISKINCVLLRLRYIEQRHASINIYYNDKNMAQISLSR